jgi:hypothetical protein
VLIESLLRSRKPWHRHGRVSYREGAASVSAET